MRRGQQDLRKMLADERNVMSTMDMEHQQQLVELEQQHQEKVPMSFNHVSRDVRLYMDVCIIYDTILILV